MVEPTRALGRAAVVLAAGSALTHLVLAGQSWERSAVTAGLLLAMAAGCLACTPMLWRGGDTRAWMTMLGASGVLLVVHARLCLDCGPAVHEQTVGVLGHLGAGGASGLALGLMLTEIVLASAAVLLTLTHPSPRAAAAGATVNPNRR